MSSQQSRSGTGHDGAERTPGDGTQFDAVVAGGVLQTAIDQVTALVDECHVQLRPEGIRLPATDPAAVASVDVHLGAGAFESFEASDGTLGVNLSRFADIVGMADRDQLVHLEYDPETRKLHVTTDQLEYTLALIDPDSIRSPPDLTDPGFEFEGSVILDASDVAKAITATSMVSDHAAFGLDPGQAGTDDASFYAEASGDTDDVDITIPDDDCIALDPGDAHSLYSLDYLADIDRAVPRDAAVEIRLGTEVPLGLSYEFADGDGTVEYLLGPRIARN